jgi:biopolymer transport protein ExbB/TolQ
MFEEMHMYTSARVNGMIRPAWTPATVALMVAGFMVFWPLGLAMIAYILFGDRFDAFKKDANETVDSLFKSCRSSASAHGRTGNAAFDDWRAREIERLNEERRKLDEMRAEFEEELRELRRAKDQDEFDRFMAKRNARGTSVPDTGNA